MFEPLSAAKNGPTLRITSPLQPDAPTRLRMTMKTDLYALKEAILLAEILHVA